MDKPKTTTVTDGEGNSYTWVNHPMFDEPRLSNILPPYSTLPEPGGHVYVQVHQGFYNECMDNPNCKLIDQDDFYYEVDGWDHKEDFFEDIFGIYLKCKTKGEPHVIKYLRRSLMSSSVMMMENGVFVKDPSSSIIYKKT